MPFQVIVAKDGHNARDVTLSGRYMPIVLLTKRVRDSLRQNATLREPFLNLLHHMYKALNAEPKLDKAQSRRPDDDDICYFFTHRFPNVQLITSEGGAGFNTNVGVNAACDRNIQIAYRLAKCLKPSTLHPIKNEFTLPRSSLLILPSSCMNLHTAFWSGGHEGTVIPLILVRS